MTALLPNVRQLLDSNDLDGAREEIVNAIGNLKTINTNILNFAALLALGDRQSLEISLGVLGRELLDDELEIESEILWLLLAAILSRTDIPSDSPARISILGAVFRVKDWTSPLFALLGPALDSFFQVSLFKGNPLIAEQTLDFFANGEESYAKAPRTIKQLNDLKSATLFVLKQIDDVELKAEWQEGVNLFFEKSKNSKYSNQNIWYESVKLIERVYSDKKLKDQRGDREYLRTKERVTRLLVSSFAAIGSIFNNAGISVAVHIDSIEKKKGSWSVNASAIDRIERCIQEIADITFDSLVKLPELEPIQAFPGSFSMIFNLNLQPDRATALARSLSFLSNREDDEFKDEDNSSLLESWKNCAATLQEDNLQVELAIATDSLNFDNVSVISTQDEYFSCGEVRPHGNIRLLSYDVPQADSLELAVDLALLLIQFPSSRSMVKETFLKLKRISDRQFSYYRRAVEILGLADERMQSTTACLMLARLSKPEQKIRFLTHQFISSNVGVAWFNWLNVNDLSDIKPDTATEFLTTVCPSLSKNTVKRRAATLRCWLKIFMEHW